MTQANNSQIRDVVSENCSYNYYLHNLSGAVVERITGREATYNNLAGLSLTSGTFRNLRLVRSGGHGLSFDASSGNAISNIQVSNNANGGIVIVGSNNRMAKVLSANNAQAISFGAGSGNFPASVTATNTWRSLQLISHNGTVFTNAAFTQNSDLGLFDNGGNGNLYVNLAISEVDRGIFQYCANLGGSNAVLTTDASIFSAMAGKVYTQDATNTSNTNGARVFATLNDWLSFASPFRLWGREAALNAPQYSSPFSERCNTGETCRIWDWRLKASDATLLRGVNSLPDGNRALTALGTTFLLDAVELSGDGDLLCESNETCLYSPNMGAYQGEGNLVSTGTFADGLLAGITLMKYETNGI